MSDGLGTGPHRSLLPQYLAAYTGWILFCLAAGWLAWIARILIVSSSMRLAFNPWAVRAIDNWGTLCLGLIWLTAMIWMENALRISVAKRRLRQTILRLLLIMAALAIIILSANFWVTGSLF